MKKLIISDIHSNMEALSEILKNEKFDEIISLGDIVGYGPDANECTTTVKYLNAKSLMGNHEEALKNPEFKVYFKNLAKSAIEYTQKILTKENFDYLISLPYEIIDDNILYCHSSPYKPKNFYYLVPERKDSIELLMSFSRLENENVKISFNGHTHYPGFFYKNNDKIGFVPFNENYTFYLDKNISYIINPGSVGQPRNTNPNAQYIIFDTETYCIEYKSLPYNIDSQKQSFIEKNLPKELYLRLYNGI